MFTDTEKEIVAEAMLEYRADPVGFFEDILGMNPEFLWSKMVEIAEAIRDYQFVAIKAGHFVSKTYTMGRIVTWFKTCFQPSTVITTAPSDNQVRQQLWREVHASYQGSQLDLGGDMHALSWDLKPDKDVLEDLPPDERVQWEKNFAIGFSTSPDTAVEHATKMQGWHNEWVLTVVDEACGILPQIWRTVIEALINDDQCKLVAIGNPTDPESEFAKACYSSDPLKNEGKESYMSDEGFYVVRIDARDNPNYIEKRKVIPGLASYEWVQRIIKTYGPEGDGTRYRVMGLFPTYKEGTFYGDKLARARSSDRVGDFPHDNNYPVYTYSDYGDMYTATIFVQFIKGRVRIISDYWDYDGAGAPAWANVLSAKGYNYKGHTAGPDFCPQHGSNKKSFATGQLLRDTLLKLGYSVSACPSHDFNSGIRAGRDLWELLEVNEPECQTFLQAAGGYCKMKNLRLSTDEKPVYHDQPAKTWHRHTMDAYRHLAVSYRIHQYTGDRIQGLYDYQPIGYDKPRHIGLLGFKSERRKIV